MRDDVLILGAPVTLLNAMGFCCFWWCFLYIIMVRSSYIIIVSGMGDDVPILGALVTLLNAMGFCCFLWCFLYIIMVGSSYIIIVSGHVVMWSSVSPFLCSYVHLVNIVIWSSGQYGLVVIWSSCHRVIWPSCHLGIWSSGYTVNVVIWSICSSGQYGHQVMWSSGH